MKIVVGLGNPGAKYQNTRHNVGFMVLEEVANRLEIIFRNENFFLSQMAIKDKSIFVKPQTFVNQSGRAVDKIKNYQKVEIENILVIHDDVDLDLGTIRIVRGGSSAGHKGVQSVIEHIGEDFWRLRLGIGKSSHLPTEKWVLEKFLPDEKKILPQIIDRAGTQVLNFLSNHLKEETIKIAR
ncbi:MAG TPA: aminoacyl-tRNA hydrolase [Patescibacteria group bacterium]|nr:aminoacyl-tRNA hydrolase [Patescibacteria group bacterium]